MNLIRGLRRKTAAAEEPDEVVEYVDALKAETPIFADLLREANADVRAMLRHSTHIQTSARPGDSAELQPGSAAADLADPITDPLAAAESRTGSEGARQGLPDE